MKKYRFAVLGLFLTWMCAHTAYAAEIKTSQTHLITLAKKADHACANQQSNLCRQWQQQLRTFILQQPHLSIDDFTAALEQIDQAPQFANTNKLFFLQQAELVYLQAIEQSHIDYLKQPSPDALPGVNRIYSQSLTEIQNAEKYKSRYIQAMCAPVRSAWAGGSGMDMAYVECKANFTEFNLKFLIETWAEFSL